MPKLAFNKRDRAKLAKDIAPMVARALGRDVVFAPHGVLGGVSSDYENEYRIESFDTVSGPVRWFALSITHRGLDVHTAFDDVRRAQANGAWGLNEFSGKWNHYLWPEHGDYGDKLAFIATALPHILAKFKPA